MPLLPRPLRCDRRRMKGRFVHRNIVTRAMRAELVGELAELVGFQNAATGLDLGFYAARSYSLIRPPRTGLRLIRSWERSARG
jgi:hypothetical protein